MKSSTFIALDVETANADRASICQLGLAGFNGRQLVSEWKSLVDPQDEFDPFNVSIHGIDEDAVQGAPTFEQLATELRGLLAGQVVVCHTHFDRGAITRAFEKASLAPPGCVWMDSAMVARRTWPDVAHSGYGLQSLCERLGYAYDAHDALEDAKAAAVVLLAAMEESKLDLAGWRERLAHRRSGTADRIAAEGSPDGPLHGEVLVFTGALSIPRREAAGLAARIGCEVAPGVTKATTMLVIGNQDARLPDWGAKSSKQKKAEALVAKGQHLHILSELDFERLVEQFAAEEATA